jgi:phage minor structural protein
MQILENIEIRNKESKTVAFLSPKSDALKDTYVDCRLNGESTLEFSLPSHSEKIKELTPECEIYANNRVYNLLKDEAIDEVMDEQGRMWTKFMAVERWNLLDTQFPEPYITNDPSIPSPADLAVIIVGGGTNLSGGTYPVGTAAHALYAVLQGSDWQMGICDVEGIHDLEAEKISRLQLIKQIQEAWGGYLVWDSVNKVVHLRNGELWQNYNGFQIRYAKNMKHINRTQSNKIVTKLYCFGKDDLDIASVNGGLKYVTDYSYTNNDYIGIYSNPDIEDAEELKQVAIDELSLNSRPRYNYNVKVVDLRVLPEYSHENFTLGDMVDIINPKSEIVDNVRIIRHKYNLFQPWQCELELGDPNERLVEKLKASFDTNAFIDRMFDSMGNMSGKRLVDGSIINNKIADAALEASKFNTKQIILTGDVWTNNIPLDGSVAWNAHKVAFDGKTYDILGGNTNKKYIVWRKSVSETQYQTYTETEFESVTLADDEFVIAVNNGGIHDIAWYSRLARQFIGSAFIADLAVKTAHIAEAAITNAKIAELAVQAANIANAAISNAKIADLAVDTFKIGDTAITEDKIANLAITSGKLANLAVTNAKIANLAVTNAKIDSMSAGKLTAGTITAKIKMMSPIIEGGDIIASKFYGDADNSAYLVVGTQGGNYGDIKLYRGGGNGLTFGIYDNIGSIDFQTADINGIIRSILNSSGDITRPKNNWDFSEASSIEWGDNYPVARFK